MFLLYHMLTESMINFRFERFVLKSILNDEVPLLSEPYSYRLLNFHSEAGTF